MKTKKMTADAKRLRDQLVLSEDGEMSDTLFIMGIPRSFSLEKIQNLLISLTGGEIDFHEYSTRNAIWVKYDSIETAEDQLRKLNQRVIDGKVISVKYELGIDPLTNRPRVPGKTHNTVLRQIFYSSNNDSSVDRKLCNKCSSNTVNDFCQDCNKSSQYLSVSKPCPSSSSAPAHNYSSKSLIIHYNANSLPNHSTLSPASIEFPFPSGLYLTRVIQLTRSIPLSDPLLQLVLNTNNLIHPSKYPKEISEAMAMVDAVQRALKNTKISYNKSGSVSVFVVGDGKTPLCAAAVCLHLPSHFQYYSIDPILKPISLDTTAGSSSRAEYGNRFHQFTGFSQDFPLLPDNSDSSLSLVVACHSHAPLQEFWTRLSSPKIAVTLPCCAHYSDLEEEEEKEKESGQTRKVMCFDDYEIYSAKRTVHIYECE
jgi:hypothetical protein